MHIVFKAARRLRIHGATADLAAKVSLEGAVALFRVVPEEEGIPPLGGQIPP